MAIINNFTMATQTKMNSSTLFYFVFSFVCINICWADSGNIQDYCPTAPSGQQTFFMNGLPCKNPANISASDFKTSMLNHAGDTDNFLQSSVTIVTAADFPGLNTLSLAIARTDLAVDGVVMPHSHPRASEMFFVTRGVVIAGFIDTQNQLFQKILREGDVFVFPQGLLHFSVNTGYELATAFSVLNSQNPGVVSISEAMFETDSHAIIKEQLMRRFISLSNSTLEV